MIEIDKFDISINRNVEHYERDGKPEAIALTNTVCETTAVIRIKTLNLMDFRFLEIGEYFKIKHGGNEYEIFPTEIRDIWEDHKIYVREITGIVKDYIEPQLVHNPKSKNQ